MVKIRQQQWTPLPICVCMHLECNSIFQIKKKLLQMKVNKSETFDIINFLSFTVFETKVCDLPELCNACIYCFHILPLQLLNVAEVLGCYF